MYLKELDNLKKQGLYRSMRVIEGAQGPRVKLEGKEVILLCSNNYLGLASHPLLKEAAKSAIEQYGTGAGASRLISGTMSLHRELEERIAAFKGTESSLIFNSGYHANLSIITTLVGRGDFIFSDKLNHASLTDGCMLSRATLKRYPHKDINVLEGFLKKCSQSHIRKSRKLIITDGLFSMDGDIAPLKETLELAHRYDAMLMVDDAHGIGVMGANGCGTLEHLNIKDSGIIEMGTLGKAIGSFGAFVAGTKELTEMLINKARPFIYTTALPPSVCASAMAAFNVLEGEPERRKALWERVSFLRDGLRDAGFNTLKSETQIIPILIGESDKTMEMSEELLRKGVFIQGIRPPTVPRGTGRLRATLMADLSYKDLKYALSMLVEAGRKLGVIH
ncbi:MAG: 8-amino-7-oxononanoate synthase [Thermodesulfobacteriota bacterium]